MAPGPEQLRTAALPTARPALCASSRDPGTHSHTREPSRVTGTGRRGLRRDLPHLMKHTSVLPAVLPACLRLVTLCQPTGTALGPAAGGCSTNPISAAGARTLRSCCVSAAAREAARGSRRTGRSLPRARRLWEAANLGPVPTRPRAHPAPRGHLPPPPPPRWGAVKLASAPLYLHPAAAAATIK